MLFAENNYKRKIKFFDLKYQNDLIMTKVREKFQDIITNASFVSGKYVKEFEYSYADYIGVKHCLAINNGTNALFLTLLAEGIGVGDEVIIPVNTFIATAEAVSLTGARPVFVDVDKKTYNIDPYKIKEKITRKTKAIIPVHLYGQCAEMDSILQIAKKYKLIIIEDACQAHGAEYKGRKAGSIGKCAVFSFYPSKNLGAWGEGGAIVTNDDTLAEKVRLMRNHGSRNKYYHELIGGNFRMSEFQGAVLLTKFKYLDKWNERRNKIAKLYLELLKGNKNIILPYVDNKNKHIWHLFVIRVKKREGFIKYLKENGVETMIHYPFPLHLTKAYKYLGYREKEFPIAERLAEEIVSLPMYPELKKEEVFYIVNVINQYYE